MPEIIVSPLLAGLAAGIYCIGFCFPFIAPVLVTEARAKKQSFFLLLKFIFGRLLGYIVFGAVFGYLGGRLTGRGVGLVVNGALVLLSLFLVLHALGLKQWRGLCFLSGLKKYNSKFPLLMGFLMGVNVCPAFLLSLTYVFTLHSALKGIVYFLMFFLGTSVYFLPLFFLGYLNHLKEFQRMGRISALVVGALFFSYGLYQILLLL